MTDFQTGIEEYNTIINFTNYFFGLSVIGNKLHPDEELANTLTTTAHLGVKNMAFFSCSGKISKGVRVIMKRINMFAKCYSDSGLPLRISDKKSQKLMKNAPIVPEFLEDTPANFLAKYGNRNLLSGLTISYLLSHQHCQASWVTLQGLFACIENIIHPEANEQETQKLIQNCTSYIEKKQIEQLIDTDQYWQNIKDESSYQMDIIKIVATREIIDGGCTLNCVDEIAQDAVDNIVVDDDGSFDVNLVDLVNTVESITDKLKKKQAVVDRKSTERACQTATRLLSAAPNSKMTGAFKEILSMEKTPGNMEKMQKKLDQLGLSKLLPKK